MELALIIGLIVIGIFFLIVEVFLIPGISIAGIASALCFISGISIAYLKMGTLIGTLSLGISVISSGIIMYWVYRSKTLDKLALKTEIDAKPEPFQGLDVKVGDTGVSVSRLGPIGKIQINGKTLEGRSDIEMIGPGTKIEVVEVGSYNVVVRRINE